MIDNYIMYFFSRRGYKYQEILIFNQQLITKSQQ